MTLLVAVTVVVFFIYSISLSVWRFASVLSELFCALRGALVKLPRSLNKCTDRTDTQGALYEL